MSLVRQEPHLRVHDAAARRHRRWLHAVANDKVMRYGVRRSACAGAELDAEEAAAEEEDGPKKGLFEDRNAKMQAAMEK